MLFGVGELGRVCNLHADWQLIRMVSKWLYTLRYPPIFFGPVFFHPTESWETPNLIIYRIIINIDFFQALAHTQPMPIVLKDLFTRLLNSLDYSIKYLTIFPLLIASYNLAHSSFTRKTYTCKSVSFFILKVGFSIIRQKKRSTITLSLRSMCTSTFENIE